MMTPHEKKYALKGLEKVWEEVNKLPTSISCVWCKNWDYNGNCNLHQQIVPKEYIDNGCAKFIFDENSAPF